MLAVGTHLQLLAPTEAGVLPTQDFDRWHAQPAARRLADLVTAWIDDRS
jgi:hypothetical protein